MSLLSERILNLPESQTIAINKRSRKMRNDGIDVINLSMGEPDFNTPEFIKEAAKKAIDDNYTHYPPIAGYKDAREAICHKLKRDNNLNYIPEQIVISTGTKQSIANVALSLLNPGDEVLLPAPYWVSYYAIAKLAEAKLIVIPTIANSDFKITSQQLEENMTSKTKMLIFSTPCNPSGSVYTEDELKALSEILERHPHVYTICDEIYELINFEEKHASLAINQNIYDRVITINGVSKGFAMTGWRCGYIAASPEIAKACDKIQGQFTSATCSITQRAFLAAIEADPKKVVYMKNAFLERRNMVLNLLNDTPGFITNIPKGAFYMFPNIAEFFGKSYRSYIINSSNDLCRFLLEEVRVSLVPGEAFGSPDYLRISYAAPKDSLRKAIGRIKNAVEKLS